MTLATPRGRIQTKIITLVIVGICAPIFAYVEDCTVYLTMFALLATFGLALEAVWGYLFTHEPGWLTFVFAAIEFTLIFTVIKFFELDWLLSYNAATFIEGIRFYLITWGISQLFLIYLLPVWRLSWIEDGGELW